MSAPFGEKSLRQTVKNLLKEKPCKSSNVDYLACIDMLENILRTGEVKTQLLRDVVSAAISNFKSHVDIGIVVGGRFSPIDCHLGARHNIKAGQLINGRVHLVMKKETANDFLQYPITSELPPDCIWDSDLGDVIHLKAYYKRHPKELMGIKKSEISRLGLSDLFRASFQDESNKE